MTSEESLTSDEGFGTQTMKSRARKKVKAASATRRSRGQGARTASRGGRGRGRMAAVDDERNKDDRYLDRCYEHGPQCLFEITCSASIRRQMTDRLVNQTPQPPT